MNKFCPPNKDNLNSIVVSMNMPQTENEQPQMNLVAAADFDKLERNYFIQFLLKIPTEGFLTFTGQIGQIHVLGYTITSHQS